MLGGFLIGNCIYYEVGGVFVIVEIWILFIFFLKFVVRKKEKKYLL